jgi:segregation and condensation protein B
MSELDLELEMASWRLDEAADEAADDASGDSASAEAQTGTGVDPVSAVEPAPGQLSEIQLEALLFVAERPLSRREIGILAGVDRATVDERLGDLEVTLAGRGIRLVLSGDRVELTTAPETGVLIAKFVGADAVRLSPAALETLAIVAYRQPITKAGIERIRGVDSDYTVRVLLHRRLVVEQGRSEAPGRPILYGTGFEFLERFGLVSLDDLPPLDLDIAARLVDGDDGSADRVGEAAAGALSSLVDPGAGPDGAGPDMSSSD